MGRRDSHGRGGRVVAALAVASIAVAATVPAASAASAATADPLPCAARDTSQVFAPWLDLAHYFAASNGGFESGDDDWRLDGGAAVVDGNEPYAIGGANDAHSLVLPTGASAVSRRACVSLTEPTIRMFVKAPGTLGALLRIRATVHDPTTGLALSTDAYILGGVGSGRWVPTPALPFVSLLAGLLPEYLTVRIDALGMPATWQVDDVYVDPFKSR
jgi:hypothetical protein